MSAFLPAMLFCVHKSLSKSLLLDIVDIDCVDFMFSVMEDGLRKKYTLNG